MKVRFLLVICLIAFTVAAEPPPPHLIKPVAVCDETQCVLSKKDWEMFVEFHEQTFQRIRMTNEQMESAQQEISFLRWMLARFAGGCNKIHT